MTRIIALLAAGMLIVAQSGAGQEPSGQADDLVGTYTIAGGERDGKAIPAEELKGITVRIAKNAITTFDKDKKEVYAATYKLDPAAKPWRITMTATVPPPEAGGKGMVAQGLVEKSGEAVKLIYALPGGPPPKEFKAGEKQQLFVLKREGK